MFSLRHQSQIRRVIIGIVAICVMYTLMTFQRSTKNLRHYQAVFVNTTSFVSHRMFRAIQSDISIADISPIWITFPSEFSSALADASHTSKRLPHIIGTTRNKATFAAIRTCNFCTIYIVDFLKIRILSCFGNSVIAASPTSERIQFPRLIILMRNKATLAAIGTCDFCTICAVDIMKFLFRFHSRTSMPCPFEKSKTFFKEIYHPLRK